MTTPSEAHRPDPARLRQTFDAVADRYDRVRPRYPPELVAELIAPLLGSPHLRRYAWDARYTTAEYLALLLTYSTHLALPVERRDGLLGCIRSLIDDRFGGAVTKRYLFELRVARRRRGTTR
jgi:hypothetical protein